MWFTCGLVTEDSGCDLGDRQPCKRNEKGTEIMSRKFLVNIVDQKLITKLNKSTSELININ